MARRDRKRDRDERRNAARERRDTAQSVERGISRGMSRQSGRGYGADPDDDGTEELLLLAFGVIVTLALVAAGLGWLDNQFGWHLMEWAKGLFRGE